MNNKNEIDMAVVELQRMMHKKGYSLKVSRKGPTFRAAIWNGKTQNRLCETKEYDNRLDAANDAWEQFKIISKNLGIKLND